MRPRVYRALLAVSIGSNLYLLRRVQIQRATYDNRQYQISRLQSIAILYLANTYPGYIREKGGASMFGINFPKGESVPESTISKVLKFTAIGGGAVFAGLCVRDYCRCKNAENAFTDEELEAGASLPNRLLNEDTTAPESAE